MELGAIQQLGLTYQKREDAVAAVNSLIDEAKKGYIRLISVLVLVKDENGQISVGETSQLSAEDATNIGALLGGLIGMGADGEKGAIKGAMRGASAQSLLDLPFAKKAFREFMDDFPAGTAAVYTLVEHRWMMNLRNDVEAAGGEIVINEPMTSETLIQLGAESLVDNAPE